MPVTRPSKAKQHPGQRRAAGSDSQRLGPPSRDGLQKAAAAIFASQHRTSTSLGMLIRTTWHMSLTTCFFALGRGYACRLNLAIPVKLYKRSILHTACVGTGPSGRYHFSLTALTISPHYLVADLARHVPESCAALFVIASPATVYVVSIRPYQWTAALRVPLEKLQNALASVRFVAAQPFGTAKAFAATTADLHCCSSTTIHNDKESWRRLMRGELRDCKLLARSGLSVSFPAGPSTHVVSLICDVVYLSQCELGQTQTPRSV